MSTWKGWKGLGSSSRKSLGVKKEIHENDQVTPALTEEEKYVASLHDDAKVHFNSSVAKTIYTLAMSLNKSSPPETTHANPPQKRSTMFAPGRMAYVFTSAGIPDRVIRSHVSSSSTTGHVQDRFVLEQVISLLAKSKEEKERRKTEEEIKKQLKEEQPATVQPKIAVDIKDDDDDIFADAGSNYQAEPKRTMPFVSNLKLPAEFAVDVDMNIDSAARAADNGEVNETDAKDGLLAAGIQVGEDELASVLARLKKNPSTESTETDDTDTNAKPKRLQGLAPLASNEDDNIFDFHEYGPGGSDDEEADLTQLDLGVAQNKKRQLTRFDFDTHEEWVAYKDNQVHMPKAAFQFGMKGSDVAKLKNKKVKLNHGKSANNDDYDAKLNREFQQLSRVYKDKYGSSLSESNASSSSKSKK